MFEEHLRTAAQRETGFAVVVTYAVPDCSMCACTTADGQLYGEPRSALLHACPLQETSLLPMRRAAIPHVQLRGRAAETAVRPDCWGAKGDVRLHCADV